MPVTSNDIANEALQQIGGNQPLVTGQSPTRDSSAAGVALQKLYTPCVQAVARQHGWDLARSTVALATSGNAPPVPWAQEYLYPGNGVQVWQLLPAAIADANNPLPVDWAVGNTLVANVQTKVIWSNTAAAHAWYNNAPAEPTWDPLFRQTVVRLLASELAMAIEGKPATSAMLFESAAAFEAGGESRADN